MFSCLVRPDWLLWMFGGICCCSQRKRGTCRLLVNAKQSGIMWLFDTVFRRICKCLTLTWVNTHQGLGVRVWRGAARPDWRPRSPRFYEQEHLRDTTLPKQDVILNLKLTRTSHEVTTVSLEKQVAQSFEDSSSVDVECARRSSPPQPLTLSSSLCPASMSALQRKRTGAPSELRGAKGEWVRVGGDSWLDGGLLTHRWPLVGERQQLILQPTGWPGGPDARYGSGSQATGCIGEVTELVITTIRWWGGKSPFTAVQDVC